MFETLAIGMLSMTGMLLVVCIVSIVAVIKDWYRWGCAKDIAEITEKKESALRELEKTKWEIELLKTELGKCENKLRMR